MCRAAPENIDQAEYLTNTEVMEKPEIEENPEKFHKSTYPMEIFRKKGNSHHNDHAVVSNAGNWSTIWNLKKERLK